MASAITIGKREGREAGLYEGRQQGENRILQLIQHLTEDGQTDLISKMTTDPTCREEFYKKYGL